MTFAFIVFTIGAIAIAAGWRNQSFADVLSGAVAPPPSDAGSSLTTPSLAGADTSGGGGWGGSKAVVDQAVAIGAKHGLKVTSAKRATKNTLTGGVSDHWSGCKTNYAADQGGPVSNMDAAAKEIQAAFGFQDWKGVQTIHVGGYRIQLLYRTLVGGNHFNHIHVGARKEA